MASNEALCSGHGTWTGNKCLCDTDGPFEAYLNCSDPYVEVGPRVTFAWRIFLTMSGTAMLVILGVLLFSLFRELRLSATNGVGRTGRILVFSLGSIHLCFKIPFAICLFLNKCNWEQVRSPLFLLGYLVFLTMISFITLSQLHILEAIKSPFERHSSPRVRVIRLLMFFLPVVFSVVVGVSVAQDSRYAMFGKAAFLVIIVINWYILRVLGASLAKLKKVVSGKSASPVSGGEVAAMELYRSRILKLGAVVMTSIVVAMVAPFSFGLSPWLMAIRTILQEAVYSTCEILAYWTILTKVVRVRFTRRGVQPSGISACGRVPSLASSVQKK